MSRWRTWQALLLPGLLAATAPACVQSDLDAPAAEVALDEAYFRCQVQPRLTKYCGTFVCHGSGDRYFRLYGRNRLRRGLSEEERNAFMTDDERQANFVASAAMVDTEHPGRSPLLLKPLDQMAGGAYHWGAYEFGGGDVFTKADDPDYAVLVLWVAGETADPDCVEPGSDQ